MVPPAGRGPREERRPSRAIHGAGAGPAPGADSALSRPADPRQGRCNRAWRCRCEDLVELLRRAEVGVNAQRHRTTLSVAMATYNGAAYIDEQLESIA